MAIGLNFQKVLGGGYALIAEGYVLWLHQKLEKSLIDYKFFCFNGIPELLYVSRGLEHHPTAKISFYSLDGVEKEFWRSDYRHYRNAVMPSNYHEMRRIAEILAKKLNNSFIRIDLYSINGKTYFSEITFSPCSGMLPFEPMSADEELGKILFIS